MQMQLRLSQRPTNAGQGKPTFPIKIFINLNENILQRRQIRAYWEKEEKGWLNSKSETTIRQETENQPRFLVRMEKKND